jgi:four helix bundle protein
VIRNGKPQNELRRLEKGVVMAGNAVAKNTSKTYSLADLRIYQLALEAEEKSYKLALQMPSEQFEISNRLRRAGAGVPHYIYEFSRRFAYRSKIDALHEARLQAEEAIKILENMSDKDAQLLIENYTSLVKQTWGLIKYLRQKLETQRAAEHAALSDKLVIAKS